MMLYLYFLGGETTGLTFESKCTVSTFFIEKKLDTWFCHYNWNTKPTLYCIKVCNMSQLIASNNGKKLRKLAELRL